MRRAAFPFAVLAALWLAAPLVAEENRPPGMSDADASEIPLLPSDAPLTSHKVVLITDESLNPRLVTLDEGQLVAWISYSASESVVVFAREVARVVRNTCS